MAGDDIGLSLGGVARRQSAPTPKVLVEILERAASKGDADALDEYTDRARDRVWKAQHFSYWMTTMPHTVPEATAFDVRLQVGEPKPVVTSRAGSTHLAEAYTGCPPAEA